MDRTRHAPSARRPHACAAASTVLGIALDTTGALFEGPAAEPITQADFFAAVSAGAMVEQTGTYNPQTNRVSGGVMALILAAPPAPVNSPTGEPAPVQLLIGPLGNLDRIYRSGFE